MKICSIDVGVKNLAYCILEDEMIKDWGIISVQCNTINFGIEFMKALVENSHIFLPVDRIVIELQPPRSMFGMNFKAAHYIEAFIYIDGFIRNTQNYPLLSVEYMCANEKWKCINKPIAIPRGKAKQKDRKDMSIEYSEQLLHESKQDEKFIKLFNDSKKKDDLADSFLQGMSYFEKIRNGYAIQNIIAKPLSDKQQQNLKYKYTPQNIKFGLSKILSSNLNQIWIGDNIPHGTIEDFISQFIGKDSKMLKTSEEKKVQKHLLKNYKYCDTENRLSVIIKEMVEEKFLGKTFHWSK